MRISDWSSDVCSSDLDIIDPALRDQYLGQMYFLRAWYYFHGVRLFGEIPLKVTPTQTIQDGTLPKATIDRIYTQIVEDLTKAESMGLRSEEHTSELQSLMRISYAVFCLKKKNRPKK